MATHTKMTTADNPAVASPSTVAASKLAANDFWKTKTIEELAAEQGVKPATNLEHYIGAGRDLWDSDEDFEEFLKVVCRRNEEGA